MNTLYELPSNLFRRVQPLYTDAPFDQPCYDSVFEGKQAARMFVDNADAPKSALMCRSYEFFPAGVAAPALRRFIADAPAEAGVFAEFYGYAPLNLEWKDALLADYPYEVIRRCHYAWEPGTPLLDWRGRLPAEARIVPVDRALAERLDRDYYPVPFVLYDWGSYEAHEAYGFGYALLVGDAVASSVTATTVSDRHALITVATEPEYRQRGFATLVSACFVEETLRRGLLPVWDTDDTNLGSLATARRLGFVERDPFVELALPNRAKPEPSRGLWSSEQRADGVVVWRRKT